MKAMERPEWKEGGLHKRGGRIRDEGDKMERVCTGRFGEPGAETTRRQVAHKTETKRGKKWNYVRLASEQGKH